MLTIFSFNGIQLKSHINTDKSIPKLPLSIKSDCLLQDTVSFKGTNSEIIQELSKKVFKLNQELFNSTNNSVKCPNEELKEEIALTVKNLFKKTSSAEELYECLKETLENNANILKTEQNPVLKKNIRSTVKNYYLNPILSKLSYDLSDETVLNLRLQEKHDFYVRKDLFLKEFAKLCKTNRFPVSLGVINILKSNICYEKGITSKAAKIYDSCFKPKKIALNRTKFIN